MKSKCADTEISNRNTVYGTFLCFVRSSLPILAQFLNSCARKLLAKQLSTNKTTVRQEGIFHRDKKKAEIDKLWFILKKIMLL